MKKKSERSLRSLLAGPYVVWMTAFIIIPLIMIFIYGLTNREGAFTLENILAIADPVNRKAFFLSLRLSLICTLICLLLAYPLAIILSHLKAADSLLVLIFILPMWMNSLLRTLAWMNILERNGILNQILRFFGLPELAIINTPAAIVLGMVYNFLPFMILLIYNVLSRLDENVVNAARDLGANKAQTFAKVILPLSLPGVISGITMVFVPSLTTFVISDLLGGSKVLLIGNVIEQKFKVGDNWYAGSGLSLVLMVFILISMALTTGSEKKAGGQSAW